MPNHTEKEKKVSLYKLIYFTMLNIGHFSPLLGGYCTKFKNEEIPRHTKKNKKTQPKYRKEKKI